MSDMTSGTSKSQPILPLDIWQGLVAVIEAAHRRDYEGLARAGRAHPILADQSYAKMTAVALRSMAYIALASHIDHRPIVDLDAEDAARLLTPRINVFSSVEYDDVLDATRLALYLPVARDVANRGAATRIGGLWISIIGSRIDSMEQIFEMKADVENAVRASS